MELKKPFYKSLFMKPLNLQYFSEGGEGEGQGEGTGEDNKEGEGVTLSPEVEAHFKKLLQQETDRVRTKAAKDKKALEEQLEKLKTDKMTDAQRAEHELQKQREELERDRAELSRVKLESKAVDLLKDAELPLELKSFVIASDEDSTKVRVQTLKEEFDKAVKAQVDKLYGENGRNVERSNGGFKNVTGSLKELALKNNIRNT